MADLDCAGKTSGDSADRLRVRKPLFVSLSAGPGRYAAVAQAMVC